MESEPNYSILKSNKKSIDENTFIKPQLQQVQNESNKASLIELKNNQSLQSASSKASQSKNTSFSQGGSPNKDVSRGGWTHNLNLMEQNKASVDQVIEEESEHNISRSSSSSSVTPVSSHQSQQINSPDIKITGVKLPLRNISS